MKPSELIHFRASGVSLVIDVGAGRLPRIVHWGGDLGPMTDDQLQALREVSSPAEVAGAFDDIHAVSLVPEPRWGWQGTPGIVGSREGLDHSTAFETVDVAVESVDDFDGTRERVVVVAEDPVAELSLAIEIELLASGLVRARASLASLGNGSSPAGAPYGLARLFLALPVPREATEILDFTGRWIQERTPQRTPFNLGCRVRDSRGGKPGHDAAFVTAVGSQGFGFRSGELWMTHVAWSGNVNVVAERRNDGTGIIGGCDLLMAGEVQLLPGESFQGPWIYGAYSSDGLDTASSRFHTFLRGRSTHPRRSRPVTVNTWEAVYFDHDEERLRALADAAVAVGAERFVLDDGWFLRRRADNAGLGDWFVDPEVYANGLAPIADYVRSQGLEFGLWVEPEMISPDSDLARSHPDWVAQPGPGVGRLPLEGRRQQVLNLTHPGAYQYIEERLHALVNELRPTYLKWDHNRDLLEAGSAITGRPIVREQTFAFYRLLDGLRAEFPELEIESCAGGGGRIDLGVLERADRVWASDCNDPHERQAIQRWTQLIVPPEMIGTHIGPPRAHTTHRFASLDFRATTALWGHLGIEWDVSSAEASTPENRTALASWVALHKRFRDLLHSGTVVNSDLPDAARSIHGVVAPDGSEALFEIASLDTTHVSPVGLVRLPGLMDGLDYDVAPVTVGDGAAPDRVGPAWWQSAAAGQSAQLSGRALRVHGVQVSAMAPDDAVLLYLSARH